MYLVIEIDLDLVYTWNHFGLLGLAQLASAIIAMVVIGEIIIAIVACKLDGFVPSITTAIEIIVAEDSMVLQALTTSQSLVFDSDSQAIAKHTANYCSPFAFATDPTSLGHPELSFKRIVVSQVAKTPWTYCCPFTGVAFAEVTFAVKDTCCLASVASLDCVIGLETSQL